MNYRSYADLSRVIRKNLSLIQAKNFDLIVGIPRSGMTPAYMIALYLNKKCCDFDSLINNIELKTGVTRSETHDDLKFPHDAKRILLVDDSVMSGKSIQLTVSRIPDDLKTKITTMAIYSSEKVQENVDHYLEYIAPPRAFEWNIFHHEILDRACFDIDGVLCEDPSEEQNDDGEKYINFILNAPPLFIPTRKINYLVTSRLEKYRTHTEEWLNKSGIKYNHLVMLDLPNKEERQRLGAHADHKAKVYKQSGQDIFFESDRDQAIKINELTKKPVYCVQTNEMFTKGSLISPLHLSNHTRRILLVNTVKKLLPRPIFHSLRSLYRKVKKKK